MGLTIGEIYSQLIGANQRIILLRCFEGKEHTIPWHIRTAILPATVCSAVGTYANVPSSLLEPIATADSIWHK